MQVSADGRTYASSPHVESAIDRDRSDTVGNLKAQVYACSRAFHIFKVEV